MKFAMQTLLNGKIIFVYIFISILSSFITFSYFRELFRDEQKLVGLKEGNTDRLFYSKNDKYEEQLILLWTWPFGTTFNLDQCDELYGIAGCKFTTDRSWYNRSYAVILHHRDVCNNKAQLPQDPRPETQRWVWFNLESPRHSPNLHFMDNRINLTMNYRVDSDIFSPYGWVESLRDPQVFIVPNKTKLVAWIVSNWDPTLVRVAYYNELKKHLNIDMYGQRGTPLAEEKLQSTVAQYKFYLAFENSLAKDYITKKFWRNALISGTVPVVLGTTRENYEQFIPGDTFIHVNDFPSAKELAAYLHYLDSNDEQYRRYFHWRKILQPINTVWSFHFCKACQVLRQNLHYKTIPSIYKWFKSPELELS